VAQLGERLVRNEEVSGSIPLGSTNSPDPIASGIGRPPDRSGAFGLLSPTPPPGEQRPPVAAGCKCYTITSRCVLPEITYAAPSPVRRSAYSRPAGRGRLRRGRGFAGRGRQHQADSFPGRRG